MKYNKHSRESSAYMLLQSFFWCLMIDFAYFSGTYSYNPTYRIYLYSSLSLTDWWNCGRSLIDTWKRSSVYSPVQCLIIVPWCSQLSEYGHLLEMKDSIWRLDDVRKSKSEDGFAQCRRGSRAALQIRFIIKALSGVYIDRTEVPWIARYPTQ